MPPAVLDGLVILVAKMVFEGEKGRTQFLGTILPDYWISRATVRRFRLRLGNRTL